VGAALLALCRGALRLVASLLFGEFGVGGGLRGHLLGLLLGLLRRGLVGGCLRGRIRARGGRPVGSHGGARSTGGQLAR
jgi:hypothetical protein